MGPSPFEVSRHIGNNVSQQFQKQRESNAIEEILSAAMQTEDPAVLQQSIGKILSQVSPERQGPALQLIQGMTQSIQAKQQQQQKQQQGFDQLTGIEQQRGLTPGSLSPFFGNTSLAEKVTRPEKPMKQTQASQPINPEQRSLINQVRSQPEYEDLDEVGQYRALTNAGVSKENAEAEAKIKSTQLGRSEKAIDRAYDAHKDFINETTDRYKGFEQDTKPKLLQMQKIASDDELIGPTSAVFLDALGIPLGALENPHSELYNKLSLDLLKGLPETYGNRILKVEVDNFLKTIPSLLNSPDGRRMIASNMLKLGEMKEVYYREMRNQQREYLDKNKPFPKDFQQRVFDQVKPQIDKINQEFIKLSDIKAVPPGTIPFFDPSGEIKFVPKEFEEWGVKEGGKKIW